MKFNLNVDINNINYLRYIEEKEQDGINEGEILKQGFESNCSTYN